MSTLMATKAKTLKSYNPATGKVVGEVPVTPAEEIAAVVARARVAQPAWRELELEKRRQTVQPLGPRLLARAEELGRLLTQ